MSNAFKFFPKKNGKNKNVQCESVAIKKVTGVDEDLAAGFADAKGKPQEYGTELIKISVTEYDGQAVQQPWNLFDTLELATRRYITMAFAKVNSVDADDTSLDESVPLDS